MATNKARANPKASNAATSSRVGKRTTPSGGNKSKTATGMAAKHNTATRSSGKANSVRGTGQRGGPGAAMNC